MKLHSPLLSNSIIRTMTYRQVEKLQIESLLTSTLIRDSYIAKNSSSQLVPTNKKGHLFYWPNGYQMFLSVERFLGSPLILPCTKITAVISEDTHCKKTPLQAVSRISPAYSLIEFKTLQRPCESLVCGQEATVTFLMCMSKAVSASDDSKGNRFKV